jgi:hypothetical protein
MPDETRIVNRSRGLGIWRRCRAQLRSAVMGTRHRVADLHLIASARLSDCRFWTHQRSIRPRQKRAVSQFRASAGP